MIPKRCYLGEGYGTLDQPEALKGAISEKEITIFELEKVLFSQRPYRELPGAYVF